MFFCCCGRCGFVSPVCRVDVGLAKINQKIQKNILRVVVCDLIHVTPKNKVNIFINTALCHNIIP